MCAAERNTPPSFADPSDLNAIEAECWNLLSAAVHDRECGWRLPVLCTSETGTPRQRIVVLREVNVARRMLFVHSDVRSAKIAAIQANPRVSWLFYDAARQVQLQLTGTAVVHVEEHVTDWLWQKEPVASLRGYLAVFPPGAVCGGPETNLPEHVLGRIPEPGELLPGRKNFAVISSVIESAEWLMLRREGNLRAVFRYEGGQVASSDWLAP